MFRGSRRLLEWFVEGDLRDNADPDRKQKTDQYPEANLPQVVEEEVELLLTGCHFFVAGMPRMRASAG